MHESHLRVPDMHSSVDRGSQYYMDGIKNKDISY